MEKIIAEKWDLLEAGRSDFLVFLSQFPESRLFEKETLEKWSVVEVIHHLYQVDQLSLRKGRKSQLKEFSFKSGLIGSIKGKLLLLALRLPFKFRAPEFARPKVSAEMTFQSLIEDWSRLREEMRVFFEGIQGSQVTNAIFFHPYAGKMPASEFLNFLHLHQKRHFDQIGKKLDQN